jgi:hypothetical protein
MPIAPGRRALHRRHAKRTRSNILLLIQGPKLAAWFARLAAVAPSPLRSVKARSSPVNPLTMARLGLALPRASRGRSRSGQCRVRPHTLRGPIPILAPKMAPCPCLPPFGTLRAPIHHAPACPVRRSASAPAYFRRVQVVAAQLAISHGSRNTCAYPNLAFQRHDHMWVGPCGTSF